ncbi:MAG: YIP1 family protein [Candidatus Levybacteria bacterium]|nr:YIP1 family protein [Candidatus Levybacteria bacterium]
MNKFLLYLRGVIFTPTKTFQAIAKEKGLSLSLLLFIAVCLQMLVIFQLLLTPQENSGITTRTSNAIEFMRKFYPLFTIPMWFVIAIITHAVARRYSQKGSFTSLVIVSGLLSIIANVFGVIENVIEAQITLSRLIRLLFTIPSLWIMYLQIIAISIIYNLSKGRAFLVFLISGFVLILLYGGIVYLLYR